MNMRTGDLFVKGEVRNDKMLLLGVGKNLKRPFNI